MAGRHHDEEQARLDKEDRRSAEMDELGSKVFNLKIALQEYEDRLAKLYQTEDRSKWKGPATLLTDLQVADREVDRLENTVANLKDQLQEARGRGGDGDDGAESGECMSAETRDDEGKVDVGTLRDQIAALEEDNRVLADAAGWELCEGSEGEEEDALLVPTGPSQRVRVIEALSMRMRDLTALLDSALARENDARAAAEDASARMDDAVARTEELQAAVLRYKRGKVSAEGRESALKSEIDELRSRGGREGGGGAAAAVGGEEKATVAVGVMARLPGASTRATGVNTEEGWPGVHPSGDKFGRKEADAVRWQEACERANAQLREERSLGEETAQRLSEKDTAVRDLTRRLREAEKAAAAATAAAAAAEAAVVVGTRPPTGVRQHGNHLPLERQTEGRLGGGDDDTVGDRRFAGKNGDSNRRRGEQDDEPSFASSAAAADAAAAAAAAATANASNDSYDSYLGPGTSTTSTDEDAVWKGRARASAETRKDADGVAWKHAETGGAAAESGHARGASRREGNGNDLPVPEQKAAASGGALHGTGRHGEGGPEGRAGPERQEKQHPQRRPRRANEKLAKHDMKLAGVGEAERLEQKEQQQQQEEQCSIGRFDLDPRPVGFPASSSRRRRRRRSEGEGGIGGDFGESGGDHDEIDDDELSTAECSAETTGAGRDAVGVGFDVASDGDGVYGVFDAEEFEEGDTEDSQPVDGSVNPAQSHERRGRERWHQQQQPQPLGSDGWRAGNGSEDPGLMQTTATAAAGDASAKGNGRFSAAAAARAESAARRAEASAQRAERAAESARVDRDGAGLAAVEADAAVVAAKAALKIAGAPTAAPSHGYFTGADAVPRPRPINPRHRPQPQPPADAAEVTGLSERSSDTESRRAERLSGRASMMARLEALAAATEAERAAGSATGRRGRISTPWNDGPTAAVYTTAPDGETGVRNQPGEGDVWTDSGLERVADVEAAISGGGAVAPSTVGAGKPQASGRAQDVDYWNRPVAAAAAAAAGVSKPSQRRASRRHRTSSKVSKSKPSVASAEEGGARSDLSATVEEPRDSESGATGHFDDRHRHRPSLDTPRGASKSPTSPPPLPLLSVGRKRLAEVGVGQAGAPVPSATEGTALSSQEARRRRVLQHVEVGRGGDEHYRDLAKLRSPPIEDDLLHGVEFVHIGADAVFGNEGEERPSAQLRRSASSENVFRRQGERKMVGGGLARSSPRPKKTSTKKRKSRPAFRAAAHTAPLGSRQALGYVHAHGAVCARRCASPACPCGEAAATVATARRFRPGVIGTRR